MSQNQTLFLYDELIISAKNPDETITFCTSRLMVLNNLSAPQSTHELQSYIGIYYWLTSAYNTKQQYKNILKITEPVLHRIKGAAANLKYELMSDSSYRLLLFNHMVARFYILKDYKTSSQILKTLVAADPANDLFKLWKNAVDKRNSIKVIAYFSYIFLAIFIASIAFPRLAPKLVTVTLRNVSGLGVIFCLLFDFYIKRKMNKGT